MILATKSGWLIAVDVVRETRKATIVKARDEKRERRIPKDSEQQKLFSGVDEAMTWQGASLE